jgi:hypothetical protein
MTRLFSLLFLGIFTLSAWSQQATFQGRIVLGRDLASFETNPPVSGAMYLLAGSATEIKILSQEPFVAEVEFVEGEWQNDHSLVSHKTILRFEGPDWASRIAVKKPRKNPETVIYPYRKFQVAAVGAPGGFRVLAVPLLF